MNKQTLRMVGWAAGALLVTFTMVAAPGCGSSDSPSQIVAVGGNAGTSGTGGTQTGGSSGTAGTGGAGGTSGSSGTGGNTGGTAGTGGTDVDAGDAGGAAGEAGPDGEAGYGSKPQLDGGDAQAEGGSGGSAGDDSGTGGSASGGAGGSSGTGGTGSGSTGGAGGSTGGAGGSTGGSSGTGGAGGSSGTGGTAGTGGTTTIPCPSDCSGHGTCDTSTGICACANGYQTPDCGSCAAGYKNYPTCYAIQACPANCSGHGTCNDQTGVCDCDSGYDTANCGVCASGYTGYPNCQVVPQPFSCVNPTRNTAFDSFLIDGIHSWLAGGIWGTSDTNVYVGAQNYINGTIAHWNGSQWLPEDLTPAPRTIYDVWGTSDDDIWVAATDPNSNGLLFHKRNGVWTDDPNKPNAKSFQSVWGPNASDVFAAGAGAGWVPMVWRRSGTNWSSMTTPSFAGPTMYYGIWGLDANHVFVPGFHDPSDNGNNLGILLYFDGSTWTSVQVPADCKELRGVHGTSMNDVWVSGITTSGKGVVYRITDNLGTWTPYVNQNLGHYQPIFSARAGTALAIGGTSVMVAGNLRFTTFDQVSQPATSIVDGKAYGPGVDVWYNSGKAWFVSISDGGAYPSGVYTLDCN